MGTSKKSIVIVKLLKILGWTLLGIVLLLGVLLFCAVKFLDSKRLAPLVERIANDYIDGDLKVWSVKLGFNPGFPILGVEVGDLSIISHAFDSLTAAERGFLPNYADSLLTLDRMTASLDIKRLIINKELSFHNVVLRGLSVNLVIAHNGKANYEVVKMPSDTLPETSPRRKIEGFRINRFALEQPKEIRFYNAADSTSASVLLLTDAAVEGDKMPTYSLKINGNVTSPKATFITSLDHINFGVNGKIYWDQAHPGLVAMDEMELQGAFLKAVVTGEIDLEKNPIIKKGIIDLKPVALSDLLTMLPDSIRRVHQLYEPYFSTDAIIGGRVELKEPMDLTTDTLPTAQINLYVPPAALRYGNTRLEELALDVNIRTLTNRPDSTVIEIRHCILAGEATRLKVSALLSKLFSDPSFDTNLEGELDLSHLPPIIREKIPGYLSGIISTDLHANGSLSTLKHERLHRLAADGSVTLRNVYFLSADTNKMVELNKAKIDFNSTRIVDNVPLLSAKLDIDTATVLVGGVDIAVSSLELNAGVENSAHINDTTLIVPVGGNLNVGRLNIISITDSAGARIGNIGGHVMLNRYKSHGGLIPEILADLKTGSVSAGSLSDRILLNDTKIKATLHKQPSASKRGAEIRRDKPKHRNYTYLSPKAVFKHVYDKRHRKPGQHRTRRVYGVLSDDDNEVLEWNLAKGFSKFLNEWKLNGSLSTQNARLLTPVFPLHNRFSRLDVRFNNDTVDISNISLLAGHTDITLSGLVSNVRRSLTSKTDNTLKMNLSLQSDNVDINELSSGAFTGAAYVDHRRHGRISIKGTEDDKALESRLDALMKEGSGSSSPLLVPVNVDANVRIDARNVAYGDLIMQNMGGDLLVYDGGVNLHNIKANSETGDINISALYSAPNPENMRIGFGMELEDFNIGKFVKLVPVLDSIMPLIHDFSGTIGADIAATCRIDSNMNFLLPTLNAAVRINGDNLAFIDPEKYRTLGKWLGFKNKADNTISHLNVEMTVADGIMRVYPFVFNIDRYRLGIYGSNDIAMNFDYHISVLKSPLPFKFGITLSGNPKKHKVRFGGAKFKEDTAIESVNVVNESRINLIDEIENVFKRGVRNSRFAKLKVAEPIGYDVVPDPGLSASDSLQLIQEGLIEESLPTNVSTMGKKPKEKSKKKGKK